MGQRKASYRHTAYDDAFRTIEQECDDALIHFVNQMFGEKYKLDAKIDRLRNEHYTRDMGGKTRRRVTDSHFRIEYRGISKNYHLECESQGYSEEILFRMFEYDVSQSTAEGHENKLIVRIPISGLLVLSHTQNAPDHMIYDIETPGGKLEYRVPVVRMWDYSLDDIFDKQLYFLIPFYFFNEKNRFLEYDRDKKALKKFEKTYTEIIRRVWKVRNTKLSDRSKRVIIRQMESVVNRLAYNKNNVREKVSDIMGGKALKLDWLEKYDEEMAKGREKGRKEGFEIGREEGILVSIRNLMKNVGMTAQEAMNALGISASEQKRFLSML